MTAPLGAYFFCPFLEWATVEGKGQVVAKGG